MTELDLDKVAFHQKLKGFVLLRPGSHEPNLMQMSENNRVMSLALCSAYVKCNVLTGHKVFKVF